MERLENTLTPTITKTLALIGLGLNLLSSLTNIAKTDTNIDHNYINTFNSKRFFLQNIY
ncbi:hypothetical protein BGAFAR04_Ab0025 (plasmid) [Borreliella garinii Far04]|nr:hypothetical protein BGAFAR04_Ab0025 [Borreliella garinii Far04]